MNDYILAKSTPHGFIVNFSCEFAGGILQNSAKIDTGADLSLVPLPTLGYDVVANLSQEGIVAFYTMVENDILKDENVDNSVILQTASSRLLQSDSSESEGIKGYKYDIHDVSLDDFSLPGATNVVISCWTLGNILIGRDILENFDIHMGKARKKNRSKDINTGDYILLACPFNRLNSVYLQAVYDYLGYLPSKQMLKLWILNKSNAIEKTDDFVIKNFPDVAGLNPEYVKAVYKSWESGVFKDNRS